MAKANIYAGLEIGTHKICFVVGEGKRDGSIRILGYGTAPSRGVRKGEINEDTKVQTCLNDALVRAEDRADVRIMHVFLGVTGGHIQSVNHLGEFRLPEDQMEVNEDDIDDAKELARQISIPQDHVFLHSVLRQYILDGNEGVRNPIGKEARTLAADYHFIHGIRSRIQNTIRCVREIALDVDDVAFAPIAAAQVVLSAEDKRQGALMIDFGAGTADYVLYREGMLTESGCIPLGGDHITNDIAVALQIPPARAEKLKLDEGSADMDGVEPGDRVFVEDDTGHVIAEVERAFLNEIIALRTEEIFELVRKRCEPHMGALGAGVFLTGGVSQMPGVEVVARQVFGLKVEQVGGKLSSGHAATLDSPQFSTPLGLIRYAQILDSEKPYMSPLMMFSRKVQQMLGVFTA